MNLSRYQVTPSLLYVKNKAAKKDPPYFLCRSKSLENSIAAKLRREHEGDPD